MGPQASRCVGGNYDEIATNTMSRDTSVYP